MDLLIVALPESGLAATAAELSEHWGVRVAWAELDLTASESAETLLGMAQHERMSLSVLINNAGVGCSGRFDEATLAANEACILLNDLALVRVTHVLLPALKTQSRAFILNVASLAAFFPMPYKAVYAPSKTFVLNFSLALREEMRDTPVSVSVLCPNGLRTNVAARELIDDGGLLTRLTCMEATGVARYALDRMLAGTDVIIPGRINRVIAAVGRIVPRPIIFAVVSAFWGRRYAPRSARFECR
jgi:short-subunit dehydrogenase